MKIPRIVLVCFISLLLVAGFSLVLQVSTAGATAIVVDTLEDDPFSYGDCSLRDAITAANLNSPTDACPAGESGAPDTITFSEGGTITLTSSLPEIVAGSSLIIDGWERITVSGNKSFRVFSVGTGAQLTLENISVDDGYDANHGGGIYNQGTLTIANSDLYNNSAGWGGGIFNHQSGTLSIIDCFISYNTANFGGGIYNDGTLYITDCTFWFNEATDYGGGISNYIGTVNITGSRFYYNSADHGGAIDNSNILDITNSGLGQNHALFGGGIHNKGTLYITDSLLDENRADNGAGIYNEDWLKITNSTFSENSAGNYGGGISNWAGTGIITNSTFAGNSSLGYHGGNIYNDGALTITNSILAYSPSGYNCYGNGQIEDGGHNIEDGTFCDFGPDSWPDTVPLLAPLARNGGPTWNWTHALLDGSRAIDNADPNYCPATDQRGWLRPYDGDRDGVAVCDIGAYELGLRIFLPVISKD